LLAGAVPAALLALIIEGGFSFAERWLVPRGLRVATSAR
jgi:osmoprotectant transport system permease protein